MNQRIGCTLNYYGVNFSNGSRSNKKKLFRSQRIRSKRKDWRYGASYFESKLIDYDVASNWGNWVYQAGVGNDSRDRRFNIERQQFTYDPGRAFRNKWLRPNCHEKSVFLIDFFLQKRYS